MSHPEACVSIARITKTQGLKGEFRVELLLEDDAVFGPGRGVTLSAAGKPERDAEIEFFRRQHGRHILKLRGMDSIAESEKYVGYEVKIPASDLPELAEGWFYTFQLRGCRVFAADGEYIGTVTAVIDPGGTEILKVDRGDEETLIPFADEYLRKIDVDQRRIDVVLPDELRDLNR